jgi:hypothetical protein
MDMRIWYFAVYVAGDSAYIEFASTNSKEVRQYLADYPGGDLVEHLMPVNFPEIV